MSDVNNHTHTESYLIQEVMQGYSREENLVRILKMWWCEDCKAVWGEITAISPTTGQTTNSTYQQSSKS